MYILQLMVDEICQISLNQIVLLRICEQNQTQLFHRGQHFFMISVLYLEILFVFRYTLIIVITI